MTDRRAEASWKISDWSELPMRLSESQWPCSRSASLVSSRYGLTVFSVPPQPTTYCTTSVVVESRFPDSMREMCVGDMSSCSESAAAVMPASSRSRADKVKSQAR